MVYGIRFGESVTACAGAEPAIYPANIRTVRTAAKRFIDAPFGNDFIWQQRNGKIRGKRKKRQKGKYALGRLFMFFILRRLEKAALGDRKFFIKRGFQSHAYITKEVEAAITSELIKHTKGLAVEYTWEGWTEEDALVISKALYQHMKEPVKVIVNSEYRTLYVGRGYVDSMLVQRSLNENRALARAALMQMGKGR